MAPKKKPTKKTARRTSKRPTARPHTLSIGYLKKSQRWKADAPAARLIEAAGRGAPQKTACQFAGISTRTFQLWRTAWSGLDLDADHTGTDALLVHFFRLHDDAVASLHVEIVGTWADAARSDWKAAQAFLSRRDPEHFGDPKTRLEVSGPDGAPLMPSPVGDIVATAVARAKAEAE